MKNPKTKSAPKAVAPLHPDWFYRVHEGKRFFGYSNTVLHLKIESGEIPAPIALSDKGRARGWFGRTIIAWQTERESKPAAKLVVGKAVSP